MSKRYFGTDGIRGLVGEAPITPDFILKLGWASGRVFAREAGGEGLLSPIVLYCLSLSGNNNSIFI